MVLPETFQSGCKTGPGNKQIAVPFSLLAIGNAVIAEDQ